MDDIYDDLENYNDVNALEELRNENIRLKFDLKELSTKIEKMQKDFEKLSTDHKILAENYSSLWKTAKAEIERKTQIITNLNVEKDKLVLSSIQNSNKTLALLRRTMARDRANNRKSRGDDADSAKTNKKENPEVKKNEPERLRNDENRLPTPDTVSSGHTDDTAKIETIDNKTNKLDTYDRTNDSKETNAKGKRALSLKHRRKSMPVLSKQETFSSDEEYEDDCSQEDNKRERPSREDKSRKYILRYKLNHKISETSGIDEKYSSHHESSRDTYYKGKMNRLGDKYRIPRDKSRHRIHFSPEKSRRVTRDYHEEDKELIRHNRVLVSPLRESYNPLRHFRERRSNYDRNEDRRFRSDDFNEERYTHEDFHEGRYLSGDDFLEERHRYGFQEERQRKRGDSHEERLRRNNTNGEEKYRQRGASQEDRRMPKDAFEEERHRQRDDSQEDRNKLRNAAEKERRRQIGAPQEETLENYKERVNTVDIKLKQKDRGNEEKQKRSKQDKKRKHRSKSREDPNHCHQEGTKSKAPSDCDESSSKRARTDSVSKLTDEVKPNAPMVEDKLALEFAEHLQHTSCQSPDNPPDVQPIMSTINQPKEIMNTAATFLEDPRITSKKYRKGIEREKVVITTITGRNVDLVPIDVSRWDIPRVDVPQALRNPPQYTDEMVHDIYVDVENPASNMSVESGEIHSESNDVRMADYLSKNFHQDYENERINQIEARADKPVENVEHKRDSRKEKGVHKENVENKESTVSLDQRKLPPVKYKLPRVSNIEAEQVNTSGPLGILLKEFKSVCGVDISLKQPEAKLNVDETFGPDEDTQDKKAKDKEDQPKDNRQLRRRKMSVKELVEGDLALSDETSDNVIVQKQDKKQKVKEQANSKKDNQKKAADTEKETANPAKISPARKPRKSKTDKVSNRKIEESNTNDVTEKQSDVKTNKKTRKKPVTKQKTATVKETEKSTDLEKKTQDKSPKSSKGKFADLFGDSSSLITPEDLGMVTEPQNEKAKKYLPIFEDAQDAVDVNVGAVKKKELETTQLSVTSSKIDEPATVTKEKRSSLICHISLAKPTTNISDNNDTVPVSFQKINDTVHISVQNITPDMEIPNIAETKEPDVVISVQKITPNMEISNVAETKEPDVVKTVVIATGIQPEIEETQNGKLADKIENISQTAATKIQEAIPIALATSTPHKSLLLQLEAEIETNRSCNSSEVQKDESSSVEQSSMSNGLSREALDDDVPDVRIFVKRRRRLKK